MQNLSKSIKLSFELFPPKMWNNAVKDKYASLIKALVKFHPTFISCTYGANGGTKTNTLNVLQLIKQCGGVPLAHCTVANQEFADVENFIKDVKGNGISKILCLRGDLNGDDTNVMHASDLMQYVKDKYANWFDVYGAWYPERHQETKALDMKVEIARNFSNKTQVGCKKFISQCFFDNEKFLEVADTIKKDYNDVELFAGIFPMLKFVQLDRLQNLSGCEIPEDTVKYFNAHKDDADAIYEFGIKQTAHQIIDLLKHGFNNIHFFTMADEKSTVEIMNEVLNA